MTDNVRHIRRVVVLTMFLLLAAISALAQGGSIQGRIALASGERLNEATRVTLQTSRGVKATVFTDNQGQFMFRGLNPGIYDVVVEADLNRFEVTSVTVEVFPNSPALLRIVLKEKKVSGTRKGADSVSTSELDPAIPAKAKKEFERASDAGNAGKTEEAIAHLRKAIEIYPSYLMARNDLGTQLFAEGKLSEAEDQLREAMKLGPKAFNPKLNLGIVLVQQQKFAEATTVLREAIALNSAAPAARLYNGMALEGMNEFDEAEKELKASHDLGGVPYAIALYRLGHIYLNKGDRKSAVGAFEHYLSEAPNAANAGEVKALLITLR
jgi:Flp pilus assembly protein TadD